MNTNKSKTKTQTVQNIMKHTLTTTAANQQNKPYGSNSTMEKELHTELHQSTEHLTTPIHQSLTNTQDSTPITNTTTTIPPTPTILNPNRTTYHKACIETTKDTTNNITPTKTDLTEAFQGGNRDVHTIHDPG
jgi:hypothetical protein